jgi:hypothetical protein
VSGSGHEIEDQMGIEARDPKAWRDGPFSFSLFEPFKLFVVVFSFDSNPKPTELRFLTQYYYQHFQTNVFFSIVHFPDRLSLD